MGFYTILSYHTIVPYHVIPYAIYVFTSFIDEREAFIGRSVSSGHVLMYKPLRGRRSSRNFLSPDRYEKHIQLSADFQFYAELGTPVSTSTIRKPVI